MRSAEQSSAYCHYFLFFGRHNHSIFTPRGEYEHSPLGENRAKYAPLLLTQLVSRCTKGNHEI